MKDFQYESLHKFFVSIGVIAITSPMILLYLIFSDNATILLSKVEISSLTCEAQKIIGLKQSLALSISNFIYKYPCSLLISIIIGIIFLTIGLKGWYKVQKSSDSRTLVETEKMIREFSMSNEENSKRTENEVISDIDLLNTCNNTDTTEPKQDMSESNVLDSHERSTNDDTIQNGSMTNKSTLDESILKDYIRIETLVAKKVTQDFKTTHSVVHGAKIGTFEYDIVAISNNALTKDYIFEVKYIRKNVDIGFVNKIIQRLGNSGFNYANETNSIPCVRLIIVTSNNNYNHITSMVKKIHKETDDISINIVIDDNIMFTDFSTFSSTTDNSVFFCSRCMKHTTHSGIMCNACGTRECE